MSDQSRWMAFRKQAWDSRPEQDRKALALVAVVLAAVVGYFLLWHPAHVAVARLQAQLPKMRVQAAIMQSEAARAAILRKRPKPAVLNPTAMKAVIEQSAEAFQLRSAIESLEGIEPNGVRIAFGAVPYARWLAWVRRLRQQQHIRVDTLSVVSLHTEGMVKISATLVNGVK